MNAHDPRLTRDSLGRLWLTCGRGECWLYPVVGTALGTLVRRLDGRGNAGWWMTPDETRWVRDDGTHWSYDVRTGSVVAVGVVTPGVPFMALGDHWLTCDSSTQQIVRDGTALVAHALTARLGDRDDVVSVDPDEQTIRLYPSGVTFRAPWQSIGNLALCGGRVVYGGAGHEVRTSYYSAAIDTSAQVSPYSRTSGEGSLVARAVGGAVWIGSLFEGPTGDGWIAIRPAGARDCHLIRHDGAAYLDLIEDGADFLIVSADATGQQIWLDRVAINAPRTVPVPVPQPMPPVVVPRIGRPLWCGYFQDWRTLGDGTHSDNPSAPGNVSVPADFAALLRAVSAGKRVIIGADDLRDPRIDALLWSHVVAVYVTPEGHSVPYTQAGLETLCADAITDMHQRGLPRRPILSYTSGHVWPSARGVTWHGVECYLPPGQADPVALRALILSRLAQYPASAKIVLIAQSYDRGRPDIDLAGLALMQGVYAEIAKADQRVVGILWFSD